MIPIQTDSIEPAAWVVSVTERLKRPGWRYGHLTVRRSEQRGRLLELLLLDPTRGAAELMSTSIPSGESDFPSITSAVPAAHWAERAIGDFWGLRATGHLRWKSLILHEAWPSDLFPFLAPGDARPAPRESHFMTVTGEGVHEIPVGPIHAGIIEPGHFRFSCLGEVVANLEIRLGYQHRGVESRLEAVPWHQARHVAESVSSDSAAAHAIAHAEAVENIAEVQTTPRGRALRTLALEVERIANHLGDLGALASDVGFLLGAGAFARLRGATLGIAQTLSGSRLQRGFICPGGIALEVDGARLDALREMVAELKPQVDEACELFFGNPGIQERMEGVGVLQPTLAEEFGMSGPVARASGGRYDARSHFRHCLYPDMQIDVAGESTGDAFARAKVRKREVFVSMGVLEEVLESVPEGPLRIDMPATLRPNRAGVGIVESWRGELLHWITTDSRGGVERYAVRDPSFQNWTGLAIAARRNLVADFPLINKSFNLSYSGNDL